MNIRIDGERKQSAEIDINDIKFAMEEQKMNEKTAENNERENRHRRKLERKASLEMMARNSDSEPNNESPKPRANILRINHFCENIRKSLHIRLVLPKTQKIPGFYFKFYTKKLIPVIFRFGIFQVGEGGTLKSRDF